MDTSSCSNCHSCSSNLSRCTGCLSVAYCNSSCQRNAWPKHKLVCARLKLHKPVALPKTVQVSSLFMMASRILLDSMEKAAIRLVKNIYPDSSLFAISTFLTLHLHGVQSSSIRQSLLQQILSGQFPTKTGYTVCQIRNYTVSSMGHMHAVAYRDLDRNRSTTLEEEIELDEDILVDTLDVVTNMICMVISGDIPIIDLGRLYVVETATSTTVKTISYVIENEEESREEAVKNIVFNKSTLLNALSQSFLECEANLSHPPSFKLTKLDLSTNEPFHNCQTVNSNHSSKLTNHFMQDMLSLISTFPLTGRTLSSLTDLRLGNCLNSMLPKADVSSQLVMSGVGHCCPSLKVLDLRGSELDPAIAIWLLLEDPFTALHKYCYSFYKGDQGQTEIRRHREDCVYCTDQEGDEAMEAQSATMMDRRFHWKPVSDELWGMIEENDWHYVNPEAYYNNIKKDMDHNSEEFEEEEDCSGSDNSNREIYNNDIDSEERESIKDVSNDITNKQPGVEEDKKCHLEDLSHQDDSDNCCECCGDIIKDWNIEIGPDDPLFPLIHVLSASALIKCLKQSPTSACNPLASTLEVLYISGNTLENFLSEAIFPFLLTACPNIKIMGGSLAAMKGLKLFSSMTDTNSSVTQLREVDMVYPSTYDMSGPELSVAEYMMFGPHNSLVFPSKDYINALLPYVPRGMISSEKLKGYPPGLGWLNADNISLIDLYLEENPLKDITNPLVLRQMVKEDCQMVGKLCPKLTSLNISLDYPWGVANLTNFWSGLASLSLTSLQIINGRWENVSPVLQVVGKTLTNVHIILPKRNDAMQGEVDCLCKECPLLEHLYLGVGTSPLEVRDLDTFTGFKYLKTVYIGEAFTWESFLALVTLSPLLEKVEVDKINEHVVGKPPNETITRDMVNKFGSLMKENKAGTMVTVLSFSWLDLDKEQVVETLQSLMSVFPALKWLGTLALEKRELGMIKGIVALAEEEGLVIDTLDREEVRQPGEEFEGLPIGMGCCIT